MSSGNRSDQSTTAASFRTSVLWLWIILLGFAFLLAGGIPTSQLYKPIGASAAVGNGDYVSADTAALNTYYSYFIEVPSGTNRLVVDVFDADIGLGGTNEGQRDRDRGTAGWNTSVTYSLLDPNGVSQGLSFNTGNATQPTGSNNAWLALYDSNSVPVAPTVAGYQTNFLNTNGTTLTVNVPAGTAPGDLLIFTLAKDGNGGITTPTGWTLIDEGGSGGFTNQCRLGVYRRWAPNPVPANYTISWTDNEQAVGSIIRITGANATTPVDVSGNATGNDTVPTAPTITTTVNGARILRIFGANERYTNGSYPNGTTGLFNFASSSSTDSVSSGAAHQSQAAAGATGTAAFTLTSNQRWRAVTVALRGSTTSSVTPAAGHWELRVDMGAGEDVNGYAIRAHDGDATSGGTELNVYADSYVIYGVNSDISLNNNIYPFVTSGCGAYLTAWDWESSTSAVSNLTSPTGRYSLNFSYPFAASAWQQQAFPSWTTDLLSADYGVWSGTLALDVGDTDAVANYGTVYSGNYNHTSATPTAQPEANSFRMYLPSDAGTAPVKPVVTQQLSWVSGANPPVAGSTTRVRVDITVFNPTAQPITFSYPTPNNQVTATVPSGGGAVYAGNATASQGTVTGTGSTISWNPGVIAAGGEASLYYYVDATPTTTTTRVPVTGNPASGGTTARYVDETGNTTQTRATYTYGPLCELAINAGTPVPTAAVVSSFAAAEEQGRVVVRWTTAAETRTAGFYVERYDPARQTWDTLNPRIFAALPPAPAGAAYGFVDETAAAGRSYYYALTEVETSGRYRRHGPYAVTVGAGARAKEVLASWRDGCQRLPFAGTVAPEEKAVAAPTTAAKPPTGGSMKIFVPEEGLYQITTTQIAAGLGLSEAAVRQRIRDRQLRLSTGPDTVAYRPLAGGAGLVFFGQGPSSPYSNDTLYWLGPGTGLAMAEDAAAGVPPEGEPATFPAMLHVEQDRWALTGLFTNPDEDFWSWEFFIADDPDYGDRQFLVDLPTVADEGPASLSVRLVGETDTPHQVAVAVNGTYLGEIGWVGPYTREARLPFDAALLQPGLNTVELAALLGPEVEYSILDLDSFDLAYPQLCLAVGNELLLRGNGQPVLTVAGFTNDHIDTFDVTNPLRPKAVLSTGIRPDGAGGYAVSFRPSGPDSSYLALTPERWRSPRAVEPVGPSDLRNANLPADYVVITPDELAVEAGRLAAYRSAQGLHTRVIRLADIFNEFAYGYADPKAIRDFLSWAWGNWRVKPRYVVLAGTGTYDPLNHEGYGGNILPALLAGTPDGLFASDSRYGDVRGNDGVPEIAVGRLPARTAAELRAMVDKIAAYEAQPAAAWSSRLLLVADDPDVGGDFTAASETIAALLPSGSVKEKIYLEDTPAEEARHLLLDDLSAGSGLLNYFGHAGMNQLAEESVLTSEDVAGLGNGPRLPLVLAMTCVAGRFEIPGFDCLATTLVRQPDGGAIAVWAPTGFSVNEQALELDRNLIKAYAGGERVVGELILRAGRDLAGSSVPAGLLTVYTLFGDPATRLK